MITLENEPLRNHTTFRIGGNADRVIYPESEEELISAVCECKALGTGYRLIGNGSNILAHDNGYRGTVISTKRACTQLSVDQGSVYAGASVKLQRFIRFCVSNDLEGAEYLFSVPATIGGAVVMNAGRGRNFNRAISDSLISVKVFDGEAIREINKEECDFSYRSSIFLTNRHLIVLGARFRPTLQDRKVGETLIRERMDFVRGSQDHKYPTAGTVFKRIRYPVFWVLKGRAIGGAAFSEKTPNWINNLGGATSEDVRKLIRTASILSLCLMRRAQLEIELWPESDK